MKLVVLSPEGIVTGGVEALHQLVDAARRLGHDAAIWYYGGTRSVVMPDYAHYDVAVVTAIPDRPDTLIVYPETAGELPGLGHARWVQWWLSVDNFFTSIGSPVTAPQDDPGLLRVLADPRSTIQHVAQSQYARGFLWERGIRSRMLTDYVSDRFVAQAAARGATPKRDVVLYNPRKGRAFTQQLREAAQGRLTFEPIEGLDEAGVADLLASAKLYVDFGEHPGRDRIPREAAISGCCVITGSRGAAGNDIDMPIPRRFRLDEASPTVVDDFLALADHTLAHYDAVNGEFADYRAGIVAQRDVFLTEVAALLADARRPRLQGHAAGRAAAAKGAGRGKGKAKTRR
jgi:hypothetical protein